MTPLNHFVRRTMHATQGVHSMMSDHTGDGHDGTPQQVSPIAALIFFVTVLLFAGLLFSVSAFYQLGNLRPLTNLRLAIPMDTSFRHFA
jgi:hypothetical protein